MTEEAVAHGLTDVAWLRHCPLLVAMQDRPEYESACAVVGARAAAIVRAGT